MEDLKKLQCKPRVSTAEVNRFILRHPKWAASIIRKTLELEMYSDFCLCCENFEKCYEKLGSVKRETRLGCICNEFLNKEYSEINRPRLIAYFKVVTSVLDF